jgi:hypothetical protein
MKSTVAILAECIVLVVVIYFTYPRYGVWRTALLVGITGGLMEWFRKRE